MTVPCKEPVQFLQFTSLSLPTDVSGFGLRPYALSVEQEKFVLPVLTIESFDPGNSNFQQFQVIFPVLFVGVYIVCKQAEDEVRIRIGLIAYFQFLDLLFHRLCVRDENRHYNQRPESVRDPGRFKGHLRQNTWGHGPGHDVIDKLQGSLTGWYYAEKGYSSNGDS